MVRHRDKKVKGKQSGDHLLFSAGIYRWLQKKCKSMREAGAQLKAFNVAYFTASTDTVEKDADLPRAWSWIIPSCAIQKEEQAGRSLVY